MNMKNTTLTEEIKKDLETFSEYELELLKVYILNHLAEKNERNVI